MLTIAITAAICCSGANAYDLKWAETSLGTLNGGVKAMHVLSAEDNGYDPSNGTAYLLKLKYSTPDANGFGASIGVYNTGDLFGMTDFNINPSNERLARGMFVRDNEDDLTHVGELYVGYNSESVSAKLGFQLLDTPMTVASQSTLPDFYNAYMFGMKPLPGLSVTAGQITQMSFGARAMTSFGLIGEATRTGGISVLPNRAGLGQADFHDMAKVTLGPTAADTNGITVLGASYSGLDKWKFDAWNYYANDITNVFYGEAEHKTKLDNGLGLSVSGQLLMQSEVGAQLGGTLDYNLVGVKATLGGKGWSIYGALNNSSGSTEMLNGWGGDPAYTSTIFSRNAYREDVSAFKIGGKYVFTKGLVGMISHANYGQSNTGGFAGGAARPITDAEETDLVLVYKPTKDWMLKTFWAFRTSEYDGRGGVERTQSHLRAIVSYTF
ncbi:MAG: OprD family outer membrane porin [Gammaproteobacteria bacterium]|nr:OprD family outer membrane porin [Gammaproteobacteria bacterium]